MNPVKIIQCKNPVNEKVDNIGDILCPYNNQGFSLSGDRWYSKPPKTFYTSTPFIPLNCICSNTWKELKHFQIDCDEFQKRVEYKCPYTGYTHYWFVPIMIFTSEQNIKFWLDRNKHLASYQKNMLSDTEWTEKFYQPDKKTGFELNSIGKILAGAGYTVGTLVSDGYGELYDALVTLDNGDFIGGKVWVWFNK